VVRPRLYRDHYRVPNPSRNRQDPQLIALGAAIRRARLEKGLSQEHLALHAEVDRSYLGRVERGDNNVAVLTLIRIAEAIGFSASALLAEAGL
jgi:transcriptional regulator with XRE-family HTH domain